MGAARALILILALTAPIRVGDRALAASAVDSFSQLTAIYSQIMDSWRTFEQSGVDAATTHDALSKTSQALARILSDFESTGGTFTSPNNAATQDFARAILSLNSVLLTVADFNRAFGPQTSKIGEATDQLRVAQRLIAEINDIKNRQPAKGWPSASARKIDNRQFVFVILVDTLRADHVGAYGYARDTTPNIDRLAREGVMAKGTTSQASLTNTSVASIVTSLYPHSHKMLGKADWLSGKSLVPSIRDEGFKTGAFSANPIITKAEHFDVGYDHFEEVTWCRAEVVINQALRWFDRQRIQSDKIFTYIHLMDPHDIYFPPCRSSKNTRVKVRFASRRIGSIG